MEELENTYTKIWLKDGIFYGMYKKGAVIGLDQAKELVLLRKQLTKGRTVKAMGYISNINAVTAEARKYLSSDEATEGFEKMAFITKSLMIKLIGNAFVKFDKPKVPTKIFTNEKEAAEWLFKD